MIGAKGLALKGALWVVGAKGLALKGALLEPDGMLVVSELTFDVTILDKGRVLLGSVKTISIFAFCIVLPTSEVANEIVPDWFTIKPFADEDLFNTVPFNNDTFIIPLILEFNSDASFVTYPTTAFN